MASIPERALEEAKRKNLNLSVREYMVPADAFSFKRLVPPKRLVDDLRRALKDGLPWVPGMPLPVVVLSGKTFRIMDGMKRIAAAKKAGYTNILSLIASGQTYDELAQIFADGYYGEDFVEMLAMVDPRVHENLELRDRTRLAGI